MKAAILLLLVLSAFTASLPAQQTAPPAPPATTLRVLVKPAEPFSFEKNGIISGYSVDLWKRVAEEAGLPFELKMVKTLPEVLTALEKGEADVGVGAISITQEREKVLDFSHTSFESGLQILAPGQGSGSAFAAFRSLFSGDVFKVAGVFLLAILGVSNILWFVERKHNSETFPEDYKKGLWEASWWAVCTIISGGCENKAAVSVAGRLVAVVWMLGGIGLTSYITATLASAMTLNTLTSDINSVADLKGQPIGTVTGSSTETYLMGQGFNPKGFPDLTTAIDVLEKGELKAVIYDSPMLRYYLSTHPDTPLKVTGELFERQNYGFALPLGSPYRKQINEALLKLQLQGFRAQLEKKWFATI
jgi:ABC-type amino acid transport substrate-binding protein